MNNLYYIYYDGVELGEMYAPNERAALSLARERWGYLDGLEVYPGA